MAENTGEIPQAPGMAHYEDARIKGKQIPQPSGSNLKNESSSFIEVPVGSDPKPAGTQPEQPDKKQTTDLSGGVMDYFRQQRIKTRK